MCGIASYAGDRTDPGAGSVMKRGKLPFLLFFLCDAVYMLAAAAMFSVFQYWQMNGEFRLYVLAGTAAGFAVWHGTAGRVVMAFSEAIVRLIRLTVRVLVIRPAAFFLRFLRRTLAFLYRRTAGRILYWIRSGVRAVRSDRIRRKFGNDIRFTAENKRKPI